MKAKITISTDSGGVSQEQAQDVSLPTTIVVKIQRPSGTEVIEIVAEDLTSSIRKVPRRRA